MPQQSFDAWCNEQDSYCQGIRDASEASQRRAGPDSLHEHDGPLALLRELRGAILDFKGHGMPGFTDRVAAYLILQKVDALLAKRPIAKG